MKRTLAIVALLAVASGLIWQLSRPRPRQAGANSMLPREEPGALASDRLTLAPLPEVPGAARESATESPRAPRAQADPWPAPAFGVLDTSVPIAGMLSVPAEWELEDFQLELRLFEGLEPHPRRVSTILGSAELQELSHVRGYFTFAWQGVPGRYQAMIPEFGHREFFEVGPLGRTDLRIEVPPPRVVLVRCLDAASGAGLTPAHVSVRWFVAHPEAGQIHRAAEAVWREELQAWRILAPKEPLELTAYGAGLADARAKVPVVDGPSEVRLELSAAYELVLELREGGASVPWNPALRPRLVPAGGQPDHVSVGVSERSCRLVQRAGGPYALEVDTPAGYRPIPPVLVQLDGPHTHHTLELVRMR